MTDGFIASGMGIVSAFGVLFVLALLTRLITRVFRNGEAALEEAETRGLAESVEGGTEEPAWERLPVAVSADERETPESAAEVAAIALALATHLRRQGRDLEGRQLVIGDGTYDVEVGDESHSPVAVTVNGERFSAALDGKTLPASGRPVPVVRTRVDEAQRGRPWRSAFPVAQGGYWDRRGWGRLR